MSDEDKVTPDQPPTPPKPTADEPAAGWKRTDAPVDVTQDPTTAFLGDALTKASHGWLRDRFRLEEDAEGQLHVPEPSRWPDLGTRAEQFVNGLLKGFIQKTPEEKEAAMGLRDAEDVPRGTEVIGRLLTRFSNTVTDTWKTFVAEHATRETQDGKKVVDGDFVVQHGATLLGTWVSKLGEAFEGVGTPGGPEVGPDFGETGPTAEAEAQTEDEAAPEPAAEAAPEAETKTEEAPSEGPDIKVEVDLGSIFRALFSPRR
ncbi:MAG: hypothetical protein EP329_09015 [Deltaproteobacteria bacterium]|nr:MAG: hypothetical protein EP329_09015 [Deltaproteobacteria bacterium]